MVGSSIMCTAHEISIEEQRVMRWSVLRYVWDTGQRADGVLVRRPEGKRPLGRGKYQLRPTVNLLAPELFFFNFSTPCI